MITDAERAARYKGLLLSVLEVQSMGGLRMERGRILEAFVDCRDLKGVPAWDEEALGHMPLGKSVVIRENAASEKVGRGNARTEDASLRQLFYQSCDYDMRRCLLILFAKKHQGGWLSQYAIALSDLDKLDLARRDAPPADHSRGARTWRLTVLGEQIAEGLAMRYMKRDYAEIAGVNP